MRYGDGIALEKYLWVIAHEISKEIRNAHAAVVREKCLNRSQMVCFSKRMAKGVPFVFSFQE